MRGYYDLVEYMSNSDIGTLDAYLRNKEEQPGLQQIFDFGNLVDAACLERHRLDSTAFAVRAESAERELRFNEQEFAHAIRMQRAFDSDPHVSAMFKSMRKQHVILRQRFPVEYDGLKIHVRARCKFDGLDKANDLGGDVKTTACTTHAAFVQAFDYFDYDRQCAWYMDLAGINRMIYVGISKKKNGPNGLPLIFKHAIVRGDDCYKAGLAKYQKLATRYYFLIQQFLYNENHVQTI